MKKLYLFLLLIVSTVAITAQTVVNMTLKDSLILELDGYKQGNVFWQRSQNKTSWSTITTANPMAPKLEVTAPYYYRARAFDGSCDPVVSDTIQVNVLNNFSVNAGHGYSESEPYVAASGISMNENGRLTNWNNSQRNAVWFLYQLPGTYQLNFNLFGTNNKTYDFELNITPAYEGLNFEEVTHPFSYTGKGKTEDIYLFDVTINRTGYYRYELRPKSSSMSNLTIYTLNFGGIREAGKPALDTHATKYLSSPSVHLSFSSTQTTTKVYDWIYEEILVPEGFDPVASYYMSLGFFAGYMGIQTNSTSERRVLFSVWDIADRDVWPDAPSEALVSLVDKAPYTQANSFGNEGTGGQSYVGTGDFTTWKTGKPVKFLMNSRRDGGLVVDKNIPGIANKGDSIRHSIISAWYDAGEGWRYIASWRTPIKPGNKTMFDGFYSFLENYGRSNGQMARKAYYYNPYGKEQASGKWIHLNKASYSNTDGSVGQRIDFEQGVAAEDPTKFYMLSGGYGKTLKTTTNSVPYVDVEDFPVLNELDLTPFIERVDQALEREKYLENLQYYDKVKWSIVSFSSEETSGEGSSDGRAARIIDGDDNSYWHSKWTGAGSSFPHWFVIDMAEEKTINGFRIVPSGGQSRYPKDITIEVSNDPSGNWTQIWSGQAPLSPALLELNEAVSGYRYFKLSILNGYSDGAHTRIGEIYVF